LEQTLKTIQAEFGCKTLKTAKEKLKTLQQDNRKAKTKFDRLFGEYETKWEEFEDDD
jgi:hypothetical protein